MIKKVLIGLVSFIALALVVIYFITKPTLEEDGSYSPSSLALNLGTVSVTDFEDIQYTKYEGERSKVLVIFTEHKNLQMKNGKMFSTGNHPVEAINKARTHTRLRAGDDSTGSGESEIDFANMHQDRTGPMITNPPPDSKNNYVKKYTEKTFFGGNGQKIKKTYTN